MIYVFSVAFIDELKFRLFGDKVESKILTAPDNDKNDVFKKLSYLVFKVSYSVSIEFKLLTTLDNDKNDVFKKLSYLVSISGISNDNIGEYLKLFGDSGSKFVYVEIVS